MTVGACVFRRGQDEDRSGVIVPAGAAATYVEADGTYRHQRPQERGELQDDQEPRPVLEAPARDHGRPAGPAREAPELTSRI